MPGPPPALEPERAVEQHVLRAHRELVALLGDEVLGHREERGVRGERREERHRGREGHLKGEVVERLDTERGRVGAVGDDRVRALDEREEALVLRGVLVGHDAAPREHVVVGGDGRAVRPDGVGAQRDGQHQAVLADLGHVGGARRDRLADRTDTEERLEDVVHDDRRVRVDAGGRVDRVEVLREGHGGGGAHVGGTAVGRGSRGPRLGSATRRRAAGEQCDSSQRGRGGRDEGTTGEQAHESGGYRPISPTHEGTVAQHARSAAETTRRRRTALSTR